MANVSRCYIERENVWVRNRNAAKKYLIDSASIVLQTFVYDTNVGDVSRLASYFNQERWTVHDLNNRFGIQPQDNKPNDCELTDSDSLSLIAPSLSSVSSSSSVGATDAKVSSLVPKLLIYPERAPESLSSSSSSVNPPPLRPPPHLLVTEPPPLPPLSLDLTRRSLPPPPWWDSAEAFPPLSAPPVFGGRGPSSSPEAASTSSSSGGAREGPSSLSTGKISPISVGSGRSTSPISSLAGKGAFAASGFTGLEGGTRKTSMGDLFSSSITQIPSSYSLSAALQVRKLSRNFF